MDQKKHFLRRGGPEKGNRRRNKIVPPKIDNNRDRQALGLQPDRKMGERCAKVSRHPRNGEKDQGSYEKKRSLRLKNKAELNRRIIAEVTAHQEPETRKGEG